MKIESEIQGVSPSNPASSSFFVYTLNNNGAFQRYAILARFDQQMQMGNAKGLLIYEHPARLVANAIASGAYRDAALEQWIDDAEKHLDVVRRYRRRMIAIEREATDDVRVKAAFGEAFAGQKPPAEFAPFRDDTPPVLQLIALHAVRQFRPVTQLLSELEANSIAGAEEPLSLEDSLGYIAREWNELSARAPVADFERIKVQLTEITAARDALLREAQSRQDERDTQANEILTRQVLELQTSLQHAEAKRIKAERLAAKLEQANKAFQLENAELKKSIDRIYKSTSWRLTTPVRAVKSVFSR